MEASNLNAHAQQYVRLREHLLKAFPALDVETLADTLEGITDLHEMISAVIRSALVDEALESGLRLRLEDMKERRSRLEVCASKKRELALQAMSETGLTRLEQPDFTASTRAGVPALVIVSEQTIPETYWLMQPPKLDRQALLCELKRGGAIPGVELSNPKPAFTDSQVRLLKAKLDPRYIRSRNSNGCTLSYVEGWHAISEANRIFGYEAWDRRTVSATCVWTEGKTGTYRAVYTAKVRITVRAGEIKVVREGSGSCEATAASAGQAHELALNAAETDATKRALATFGNPFGLALYDPEQNGVRKQRGGPEMHSSPWVLRSAAGSSISSHDTPTAFIAALRRAMTEAKDIELLYDLWEKNIETLRALHRSSKEESSEIIPKLVAHLRSCAVGLVKQAGTALALEESNVARSDDPAARRIIDKSALAISEPKRIRCKEHLRYVASQPCVICGRSPSHAHHVRYAQRRGLGIKVSDEFAVPLCATHHQQLHNTTKEREWWQERKVDPLMIAGALWRQSQRRYPDSAQAAEEEPSPSFPQVSSAKSSTP